MREGLTTPVTIDGARGEGGGQILRTSLALSMITGRPVAIHDLRAGRAKPGLRRQHLACVEAAAALCGATVRGATLSSKYLEFLPGPLVGGELTIDIGTAGSTTLVVQTILVPALVVGQPLRATIRGGTHNPMAPPFEFLDRVFLPQLRAMGADATLTLARHGFASPESTRGELGELVLEVRPAAAPLHPITRLDGGEVVARRATAIVARLPTHVADRELTVVRERLAFARADCTTRDVVGEGGPGNILLLEVERSSGARELISCAGAKGLRAERVAHLACDELAAYIDADVPVGEHLADQLLLPLAIAGGGQFRARPLSLHATTNIATIAEFLSVPIRVEQAADGNALVTVG